MQFPKISIVKSLVKRELVAYFQSPIAYVFVSIFILSVSSTTIFIGRLFYTDEASMRVFFIFLPWIFIFLVPAIGMRLWSEERSSGSIEFLFTLPVTVLEAVIAKFLAGWLFLAFSLLMTIVYPITIFFLGSPDLGAMIIGYLGSLLVGGSFLAISCFTSAMTRNQVISFIFSFMICFILTIIGWGVFTDILNNFLPLFVTDFITSFGIISQFENFQKGVIDIKNISYYVILISGSLALNVRLLEDYKYK